MLTYRVITAVCLVMGIAASVKPGQQIKSEQHWIDALKATPVARIEADMPEKQLGEWLVANAKGTEVRYEAESCADFANANPKLSEGSHCAMVTLLRGSVVLKFAVAGFRNSPERGPLQCRYLIGWEGPPPGSPMKRMTRPIRKLSDLRTMLQWR